MPPLDPGVVPKQNVPGSWVIDEVLQEWHMWEAHQTFAELLPWSEHKEVLWASGRNEPITWVLWKKSAQCGRSPGQGAMHAAVRWSGWNTLGGRHGRPLLLIYASICLFSKHCLSSNGSDILQCRHHPRPASLSALRCPHKVTVDPSTVRHSWIGVQPCHYWPVGLSRVFKLFEP